MRAMKKIMKGDVAVAADAAEEDAAADAEEDAKRGCRCMQWMAQTDILMNSFCFKSFIGLFNEIIKRFTLCTHPVDHIYTSICSICS